MVVIISYIPTEAVEVNRLSNGDGEVGPGRRDGFRSVAAVSFYPWNELKIMIKASCREKKVYYYMHSVFVLGDDININCPGQS